VTSLRRRFPRLQMQQSCSTNSSIHFLPHHSLCARKQITADHYSQFHLFCFCSHDSWRRLSQTILEISPRTLELLPPMTLLQRRASSSTAQHDDRHALRRAMNNVAQSGIAGNFSSSPTSSNCAPRSINTSALPCLLLRSAQYRDVHSSLSIASTVHPASNSLQTTSEVPR
jgi:hypothetical protein